MAPIFGKPCAVIRLAAIFARNGRVRDFQNQCRKANDSNQFKEILNPRFLFLKGSVNLGIRENINSLETTCNDSITCNADMGHNFYGTGAMVTHLQPARILLRRSATRCHSYINRQSGVHVCRSPFGSKSPLPSNVHLLHRQLRAVDHSAATLTPHAGD